MSLLIFGLSVIAVFLFVVWIVAIHITMARGDDTATYKLYAVRDQLVGAVVFGGVERDDPWFDALYENVNRILTLSHFLAGPSKWRVANKMGTLAAQKPTNNKTIKMLPPYAPPAAIAPILEVTDDALRHLIRNHFGTQVLLNAHQRELWRQKRERARELQKMVHSARCATVQLC